MSTPRASGLFSDPALAQFYNKNVQERLDFRSCVELSKGAQSVLDLGCGTGTLSSMLADAAEVVGVDPAQAMLDIARAGPNGSKVEWVQGDARHIRLDRKFDFVVLSGHTFQVFLTADEQSQVFETIAAHLSLTGRFVFDSRNPFFPARKERTKAETHHRFEHAELGMIEAWNESSYDEQSGILTYSNSYRVLKTDEIHSAQERIRYTPQADLAELMDAAGLKVNNWLGDWDQTPFHNTAREIIPIGCLS